MAFEFTIKDTLGTVDETSLEVHVIQYAKGAPKLDVRHWFYDRKTGEKKMSKGVTLTKDEALALRDLLANVESLNF
jgi:hypothetical protein